LNSPRTGTDRPSQQQRSDEPSSAGGLWRPKSRPTGDQQDEPRETDRSAPKPAENWGRSDDSSTWRIREKKRLSRFVLSTIVHSF
jgi:hypothetical protein